MQLGHLQSSFNDGLQGVLSIEKELGLVALILLNVQSDRGARGASPRESEDDSGSVRHHKARTLLAGNATIDGVRVLEIVRGLNGEEWLRVLQR